MCLTGIHFSPIIAIGLAKLQTVGLDGKAYPADTSILKQESILFSTLLYVDQTQTVIIYSPSFLIFLQWNKAKKAEKYIGQYNRA